MPFDSPDYDLTEILKDVSTGKIQLPDFQREWKWDDDRIASLLASISLGYPIGVVMLLQVGGDSVRFAPKPLAGAEANGAPELLLLDGQQRMTSLFQALASGRPVETTDPRGKRLQRWYYVDIRKALDPAYEEDEAILSIPEDRIIREDFGRSVKADFSTTELECEAEVFPLGRLFEHGSLVDWQMAYASTPERLASWKEFHERVLRNILFYKLPAIILTKETPKEAVCVVFEKVNTGGVPLNVFELLTATFAADGFRLKDDWDQRVRVLHARHSLQGIESTDFLQAVTLLATRGRRETFIPTATEQVAPGISAKRKDVLKLSLPDYRRWADDVTDALEWCAKFLAEQRIFRASDVPYKTQLVPLAAIKVILGDAADTHAAKAKLRQWFWCGVMGELYGGTTETRFSRDVEQVVPWIESDGRLPITVNEATFRAARLLTMRTRNGAAYKGAYALLMKSDCQDWIKNEPINMATFFDQQLDIHHIFPKAWCEKNRIDPARRESIVNKTPLAYSTNRSIGGRSPSEYLQTVERQAGLSAAELDRVIERHAIDPAHLRSADFDSFFDDRSERLLALIEEAMVKPAIREDATEGDPAQFEDEPDDLDDELVTREADLVETPDA